MPALAEGKREVKSIRDKGPDAVRELARGLDAPSRERARRAAAAALRPKLPSKLSPTERVALEISNVERELSKEGLGLREFGSGPQTVIRVAKLYPKSELKPLSPRAIEVFGSVVRRDEVIDELARLEPFSPNAAKQGSTLVELRALDGRVATAGKESVLEQFLDRELKIHDHAEVAASFDPNALVKWIELKQEVTLLRLFGGGSSARGRFFFCCLERGSGAPPSDDKGSAFAGWTDAGGLATPPNNMLQDLAVMRLPPGTKMLVGIVADNFPDAAQTLRPGGNAQIFVPDLKGFPYQHYQLAKTGAMPTDILVNFEGGVVGRFRP